MGRSAGWRQKRKPSPMDWAHSAGSSTPAMPTPCSRPKAVVPPPKFGARAGSSAVQRQALDRGRLSRAQTTQVRPNDVPFRDARRYLGEAAYRLNRRFRLRELVPRLLRAMVLCGPCAEPVLRQASNFVGGGSALIRYV